MTTAPPLPIFGSLSDHYRIERELGAGGMATVYLAHDLRHDRSVAIKVLHPDLGAALGAERFLSEIKTTAKLQHPHILPLLDSGEADGHLYYVMPVVVGESLRERLGREKQLPIGDAMRIAREVAGALSYAHRHGVIHRDVKPENILLHDGQAMVADFGIALAVQQAGGQRMTQTGLSLGTPQYMSPEQAMGERTIDARSDIYALGAVTYEMLAGDPPFTGSSVQAIVAKIMNEKPGSLRTLRDTVPAGVERAVLTALAKLPADRFATAADFAAALESPSSLTYAAWTDARAPRRPAVVVGLLIATVIAASALGAWGWMRQPISTAKTTRVAVALPAGQELRPQILGFSFDISPDGDRLAYIGTGPTSGTTQVWIRPLDALEATPLANTVGALSVQWSPDTRSVLVKQRIGSTVVSVDGRVVPLSGRTDMSWGEDGRVYSVSNNRIIRQQVGGVLDTLYRGDSTHTLTRPTAFPDGEGALFIDDGAKEVMAVSFRTGKATVVGAGIYARIVEPGTLLFASAEGNMFMVPFDESAQRMTGTPVLIASVAMGTSSGGSYPQFSLSKGGTFAYITGNLQRQRLTWLDANGRVMRRLDTEGSFWGIALSPDATRIAYALRKDANDVWVQDLASGARTRLTTEWLNVRPSWSPDGRSVLYTRVGGPLEQAILERPANAALPERVVLTPKLFGHSVGDARWLPDHRTLVVRTYEDRGGSGNLYTIAAGTADSAHPFVVNPATKFAANVSADGTLIAYISDESGVNELYVERYPGNGERLLISKGGASSGRWSHDGRSLYYWNQQGKLVVASIVSKTTLTLTGAREISTDIAPAVTSQGSSNAFDVAPDGRIMIVEDVAGAFTFVLVSNGLPMLTRRGGRR